MKLENAMPCPFCGSVNIVKGERYFAMCVDCGATGPERSADATARKFTGDWNARAGVTDAQAKLDFLASKGLTVGLMKTSDRPEPYLVYVAEPGSEFDDTVHINKLVDVEIERDRLLKCCHFDADGKPAVMGSTLYLFPNNDVTREPMTLRVPDSTRYCWHSTVEAAAAAAKKKKEQA